MPYTPEYGAILSELFEKNGIGEGTRIMPGLVVVRPGCVHIGRNCVVMNGPTPFPSDTPDAPFYKLKAFCLYYAPDDRFVTSKDLAARMVDLFRTTKPFLDYINRAIDFVQEEKKEYFSSLDF